MQRGNSKRLVLYRLVAISALAIAAAACAGVLIYSASSSRAEPVPTEVSGRSESMPPEQQVQKTEEKQKGRIYSARELGFSGPASLLKWSARAHPEQVARELRRAPSVLGTPRAKLESIGSCEAGGRPDAVSADGTYRGKYQFSVSAWGSVGGRGDPAKAPEWEQDVRAAILIDFRGTSPWPNCG